MAQNRFDRSLLQVSRHAMKDMSEQHILVPPKAQLDLPFKPFTLEEVVRITKAGARTVDTWSMMLGIRSGLGVVGLEYNQTFAIFVGQKYLDEGATAVVRMLSNTPMETIEDQVAKGNTFPVPHSLSVNEIPGKGMFIHAPDSTLGKRLDLYKLLLEFN